MRRALARACLKSSSSSSSHSERPIDDELSASVSIRELGVEVPSPPIYSFDVHRKYALHVDHSRMSYLQESSLQLPKEDRALAVRALQRATRSNGSPRVIIIIAAAAR